MKDYYKKVKALLERDDLSVFDRRCAEGIVYQCELHIDEVSDERFEKWFKDTQLRHYRKLVASGLVSE